MIKLLAFCTAMIEDPGDSKIFDDICSNYRNQMYFIAKGILNNDSDAEDAVQDALFAIAKQIDSLPYQSTPALKAYVFTAARNSALNILGKHTRHREAALDVNDYKLTSDDRLFEKVCASQDYALLMKALMQLPLKYREILMMHYVNEMKTKEIADALGRKPATVHQQITRGKKMLIELCKKEGMCFDDYKCDVDV